MLARLGLVTEDPMPEPGPHGRRWRGTSPETFGAVVWDVDAWDEPAVQAVLAIAAGSAQGDVRRSHRRRSAV